MDLDDLIRTYVDLTDKIDQLNQARDNIRTELRTLGAGRHHSDTLNMTVTVSKPAARFDPDKFTTVVTDPELAAACTERSISSKKAKEILPPAVYALCCTEGGEPRVTIR